jgi:hypothetical protein
MSFIKGGDIRLFPLKFIKECIATYEKNHGKKPKILVVSSEELIDWEISCSIHDAKVLDIEIKTGDYLKPGEYDLAMGTKKKKVKEKCLKK